VRERRAVEDFAFDQQVAQRDQQHALLGQDPLRTRALVIEVTGAAERGCTLEQLKADVTSGWPGRNFRNEYGQK